MNLYLFLFTWENMFSFIWAYFFSARWTQSSLDHLNASLSSEKDSHILHSSMVFFLNQGLGKVQFIYSSELPWTKVMFLL